MDEYVCALHCKVDLLVVSLRLERGSRNPSARGPCWSVIFANWLAWFGHKETDIGWNWRTLAPQDMVHTYVQTDMYACFRCFDSWLTLEFQSSLMTIHFWVPPFWFKERHTLANREQPFLEPVPTYLYFWCPRGWSGTWRWDGAAGPYTKHTYARVYTVLYNFLQYSTVLFGWSFRRRDLSCSTTLIRSCYPAVFGRVPMSLFCPHFKRVSCWFWDLP